jgi:peroxiredoxin Q/BCP
MAGLKAGTPAPEFSLKDFSGQVHSLFSAPERFLVLYFYPKDDTPGCTIQAREFNKVLAKYAKLGAKVIGVSGGDERSKQKFCQKHNLKMTLLSDTNYTVSKGFGVYGEKSFMGRQFIGIMRTTFILDENRTIVKIYDRVKPETHADDVLELLTTLAATPAAPRKLIAKTTVTPPTAKARAAKPRATARTKVAGAVPSSPSPLIGKSKTTRATTPRSTAAGAVKSPRSTPSTKPRRIASR